MYVTGEASLCRRYSAVFSSPFAGRELAEQHAAVVAGKEVDRGGARDHALYFRAFALDGAGVGRLARAVEHAEHACQVAAGRSAGSADAVGADSKSAGIVADESHGALHVVDWDSGVGARRGGPARRRCSRPWRGEARTA